MRARELHHPDSAPSGDARKRGLHTTWLRPPKTPLRYQSQRVFVATMLDVIGRLLAAGSAVDPVVQAELGAFPEGYTIGFAVLGESLGTRVQRQGAVFHRVPNDEHKPDLEIVFKHLSHAFLVLSFQESTPQAYANDRMVTHGDIGLTMRFVRCLDRVQGVMLPRPIAARALKAVPEIPLARKLSLAARIGYRLLKV